MIASERIHIHKHTKTIPRNSQNTSVLRINLMMWVGGLNQEASLGVDAVKKLSPLHPPHPLSPLPLQVPPLVPLPANYKKINWKLLTFESAKTNLNWPIFPCANIDWFGLVWFAPLCQVYLLCKNFKYFKTIEIDYLWI